VEFTVSNQSGVLFIVATPIGNLEDISERARRVLREVDVIAAEDTRHSKKLMQHLAISTPMIAHHEHNESQISPGLIAQLKQGKNVALISDAGTPLINDPGYQLVKLAHENQIKVVPVPGASALIAALSAAGLATDSFIFEGFLADKQVARRKQMQALFTESRTLIFYEAPHRIVGFMQDCVAIFGEERQACIARELSKYYETIKNDRLGKLLLWLQENENQRKGEFVILIQGNENKFEAGEEEILRILKILLRDNPVKQATALAAEITGLKKNALYKLALDLKKS
jgi:16S rRNA (cytidine1402-2'-O)-methyltransferase